MADPTSLIRSRKYVPDRTGVYCGPVLRHPAELMLPAGDLGGRVWLGGKPIKDYDLVRLPEYLVKYSICKSCIRGQRKQGRPGIDPGRDAGRGGVVRGRERLCHADGGFHHRAEHCARPAERMVCFQRYSPSSSAPASIIRRWRATSCTAPGIALNTVTSVRASLPCVASRGNRRRAARQGRPKVLFSYANL
jgi:hypothetical protein